MELAIFKQIPGTETQIEAVVFDAKQKILSGDYNPIDLEVQLKAMEEVIKRLRGDRDIKEYVIDEANKYPEKSFHHGSVTITKANRTTYDFSQDEEWRRLKTIENEKGDDRKLREKKLKGSFVDSETGELVEAIEPSSSTIYLMIKFDK